MVTQTSLSPELQPILLCARTEMTGDQIDRLRALAGADLDWDRLLQLAAVHGLRPLVYRNLRAHCPSQTPEEVLEQLQQFRRFNVVKTLLLTTELEKILGELEDNAIPVIPYKGVTLGERLYGDAALRESGDIDIIVPGEQALAAKDRLCLLGYQPLYKLSTLQEKTYIRGTNHYNLIDPKHSTSVEVHWDIVSPHLGIPIDWPGLWERQTLTMAGAVEVRSLCPEDLLLALCIHGSKHRWEVLKWLADVAQQIDRNPNMDWSVILSRAAQWRVERMVQLGICLAADLLTAQVPKQVREVASRDPAVAGLSNEVVSLLERPLGVPEKDFGRVAYLMRSRDRWQDRAGYGWRLLTELNFQDIDRDDRPLVSHYLQRPLRIVRKNGWQPLSKMGAQMLSALDGRRR